MKRFFKWGVTVVLMSMFALACEEDNPADTPDIEDNEQSGENGGDNKDPEQEIDYFEITVSEITPTTAHVSVQPKPELEYKWIWEVDMASKTYDEDYVYKYIDDLYAYALESFGFTESEYPYGDFCNDLLIPAEYSDEYTYSGLEPETEYTVWACAVDDYGQVMSKIHTYSFTTPEVQMSSMTFEIDIDEDMNLTIIPSNDDETYIYYFGGPDSFKDDGFDSIEDCLESMAKYISSMGADLLYSGQWTENMKGYLEDGTNYVWVVGYDGGFTTEVFEFSFEYDYIPPGNNTLTKDVTDIEYIRASGFNLGDYKGKYNGLDYYEFYIYGKQESNDQQDCHTMKLYIFTEPGQENISGEYEMSDTPAAGKALKGYIDDEGYLAGCHYFHSSLYQPYALFTEGMIYIHQGADNSFNMAIDGKSDDFRISGRFSGELIIEKVNF